MRKMTAGLLSAALLLSGCTAQAAAKSNDAPAAGERENAVSAIEAPLTQRWLYEAAAYGRSYVFL